MSIVGRAGIAPVSPAGAQYQPPSPGFSRLLVQPTTKYAPAPIGGSNDDQANLVAFWASLNAGDTAVFPAGATYRHSGRMGLTGASKVNITIQGSLCTWIATAPSTAAFYVMDGADRVNISSITHQVSGATTRINLANDVSPFVFNNVVVGELSDLTATGSAGLGFYFWKATGYGQTLNRLTSNTTLADGIHFTNGSGGFNTADCAALDAGDDGFAHIGYLQDGAEAGRPQNINHARPYVRDSRARGISFAGARDCTATDVNIDGSLAANVYFAVERGDFNTAQTDRCTVTRGRLARAGTSYAAIPNGTNGAGLDQGAVLFLSSGNNTSVAVTDCSVSDVNIGNLASVNYDTIRAIVYNGGVLTRNSVNNIQLYAGCPSTFVGGNTPASISPATSTDRRNQALPAYSSGSGSSGSRPPVSISPVIALDGDTLGATGGTVASWVDSVTSRSFAQATAGLQPQIVDAPNSHRAAKFDGRWLNSNVSSFGTQQSITIAMVLRIDATSNIPRLGIISAVPNDTNNDYTSAGWNLAHPATANESTASGIVSGGGTSNNADVTIKTSSQPFGTWIIFVGVLGPDGLAGQVYTNGTAEPVTAPASNLAALSLASVYLGARRYGGNLQDYGKFSLAALRVYPGRLGATDRSSLDSEWSDRYGITVSDYVADSAAYTGTATLAGSGALTSLGNATTASSAALSGSGALSASSNVTASNTATTSGSGALTAVGSPQTSGSAAFSGTGSLTAAGTAGQAGTGSLTGSGQLSTAGTPAITGTATMSGAGALSGSGTGAENGAATATFSGSGSLTTIATPRFARAVTFTGTGALTTTTRPATSGSAALSGSGALAATGSPRGAATPALSGSGQLVAATAAQLSALANLTADGQLAATRYVADYISHTYGASGIAEHLSTAALVGDGISLAVLESDGTSTALLAPHLSTAELNTTTL